MVTVSLYYITTGQIFCSGVSLLLFVSLDRTKCLSDQFVAIWTARSLAMFRSCKVRVIGHKGQKVVRHLEGVPL